MEEMAMARIIRTGPCTSIQDLGREKMGILGIPASGAMDSKSFFWVNHVLRNSPNAAVLEVSQPGFIVEFDAPTLISIAGAAVQVSINSRPVSNPGLISIQKGDNLKLGMFAFGSKVYVGIQSGFQTEEILGSRSFFEPVTGKSMLEPGDQLAYRLFSNHLSVFSKPRWKTDGYENQMIHVYPGPDWNLLEDEQKVKIEEKVFHLSKLCNRMGFQLEEIVENQLPELPTNPVFPGTVQLTPGGKILVLMRDAGVTGGYPRILQLTENSISKLSQKKAGDPIQFLLNDF